MDNKTLRWLMLSAVCFCITEGRPESLAASSEVRQSRSIDRMVFPDSNEDERHAGAAAPMQMRRLLSPTPRAETANDCRSIKVFRNKNGTLSHQFVDCSNSSMVTLPTPVATESRFGQEPSSQHGTSVRVGGVPTATEKNGSQRDTIVFPDNESAEAASEPKCAQPGQRFCTDDASYPKSRIEMLLQRVGNLNDLLQTDVEDDTELVQRVDVPGEETFCDYDSRMEYPTKALSRDEKWLPIVNHANYTQGIRMEICRNIDRPCKMSEIFPYSIKTKCVQKYQYRQLLALHEDGQLKREYFSMPTCCLCTFSKM